MPAAIFNGVRVKLLKKILSLNGGAQIHSSTTDPTAVAVDATTGSLLLNESSGTLYRKNDNGSTTNWTIVAAGGASDGGVGAAGVTGVKTADYTVVAGDVDKVIPVDTTSNDVIITLPAPSAGFIVTVKDYNGSASPTFGIFVQPAGTTEDMDGILNGVDQISAAYTSVTYISDGTDWFRIAGYTGALPSAAARGLVGGGSTGSVSNVIDYFNIAILDDSADFGDLTVARINLGACGSSTRAIWGGGFDTGNSNVIDYVTISTPGNATDFGDLTVARRYIAGLSSSTRGVFGGGSTGGAGTQNNEIDYVTIATPGNATDFGDLTVAREQLAALASTTRGVFAGGSPDGSTLSNVIDYITIATPGNATDFGDLLAANAALTGCSNSTRGLFAGGSTGSNINVIQYITIASTGNATDFGDLLAVQANMAGSASTTRAVFSGGDGPSNVMQYVQIATLSNADDFGDLTVARSGLAGTSSAHGGI
jgi:hypothetical protein